MMIDTRFRTNQPEIMDDLSMEGEALRDTLDEIAGINRLLGGNRITRKGVERLLRKIPKSEEITIVDLGCGNGDMLRMLSDYAARNGWVFKLIGIDANQDAICYARELSALYPNIIYLSENIFGENFEKLEYDIALCTLTLHHFDDEQVIRLMQQLKQRASIGVVVNDLHRNVLAYRLFQLVGFVFRLKAMPKSDGLVSILRGFKREELVGFSKKLNTKNYSIHWKWAFRYQWIISKI
ncbi:methyltransferase domain-containing protein [Flavobacterium sp.]|uniref:methyltransferase domain-containing protein n=1 Tax=Flavobacterium sp. TaxID=239 RepID=UPI0039E61A98